MTRFSRIGLGSVASIAVLISLVAARHPRSDPDAGAVPAACALLTATEATTLGGFQATMDPADPSNSGNSCIYKRTGGGDLDPDVVEITYHVYPDAPSAHADYPKWVSPLLKPNPLIQWVPLSGVGDEATLEHFTQPNMGAGIYFRHGAVDVKVGVYPLPSDSALSTAAKTMVGRM